MRNTINNNIKAFENSFEHTFNAKQTYSNEKLDWRGCEC